MIAWLVIGLSYPTNGAIQPVSFLEWGGALGTTEILVIHNIN